LNSLFDVIHEDADLLVVTKPADLVCHPTKGDAYSSLISRARLYFGANGQPQLINRLDRETSGVVLIAKNETTAREIRHIWETREVEKIYWAIVHGYVQTEKGLIDASIGRDENSIVAIKDKVRPDGARSQTEFNVLSRFSRAEGDFTFLEVRPLTGRKHQIRIHLSHFGHPIVGDKLYGLNESYYLDFVKYRLTNEQRKRLILPNHALHGRAVRFTWRGKERRFEAKPERWFTEFLGNHWHRGQTPKNSSL
jgi:23S rRNA pseudouridine1911/1915/1917 synthase